MKPNLAVFTSELGASFVERHVRDLRPGATVAVARYSRHPLGMPIDPPCPTLFLDRWSQTRTARIRRRLAGSWEELTVQTVASFLRRHKVGHVLAQYLDEFLEFVPLMDKLGIPYVVQGHGIDVSTALRAPGAPQAYLAYRSARAILTRSEFHRQRLIGIGLPAEKIHVNPGGVDIPPAIPQRASNAGLRLLAIGLMVPQKAPILLLEAFRRARLREPELHLDYVSAGPQFDAVRQFVHAADLQGHVTLHGFASEETKLRLLRECGVFVQHRVTAEAGDEEGLPAAIQEAMAYGLAVVSTRHSGIMEAVKENVSGLLVDERDVEGMATAILQATRNFASFGAAGYAKASAEYSWAHEKSRLLKWLEL